MSWTLIPCIKKWFRYQSRAALVFFKLDQAASWLWKDYFVPRAEACIPFIFITLSKPSTNIWTAQRNWSGKRFHLPSCRRVRVWLFSKVCPAPATSPWINASTTALQSRHTGVTLNYLWRGVYRNHVLAHLCPVEAKLLIQGGELLSEGHCRDSFNPHSSAVMGGKIRRQRCPGFESCQILHWFTAAR